MGNQNRKATKKEMACIRRTIQQAFPNYVPVFGGRGGTVAPRVRTISFRLCDARGEYHSNVIWLMPDELTALTTEDIKPRVEASNGRIR